MSISQETSPPSKSSRKKLRTSVDQLVLSTPSDTPNNDAKLSKKRRKDVEPLPAVTDAISELALVASPDNTVDVPSRRKKKHRITIEENAEAQPSSSTTVSGPPALVVAKKTKKKLRFAETVDNSAENILPASDVEQVLAPQIEKKRTKKRSETLEAEPAEEAFTSEIDSGAEQGKKRKKSQSSASDNFSVEDPPSITQSKKRKAESNPESNPLAKDRPKSSKKKRKSAVTEFPDPADDETLSEQAMKALSYAHAQVADPASWKFHKARQNWLLRNAWSESSIPEKHFHLLTHYLTKIQGGIRDNLIKTCEEVLEPPNIASTTPASGTEETSTGETIHVAPESNALKMERARALLTAFSK